MSPWVHAPKFARGWQTKAEIDRGRSFSDDELREHLARMERCRLSGCTPDEHRCLDDEQDWGPEAA